jgi:hypothetical protein
VALALEAPLQLGVSLSLPALPPPPRPVPSSPAALRRAEKEAVVAHLVRHC